MSRDNDRRETRKELRAIINEINKKIDELVSHSNTYLTEIDNKKSEGEAQKKEILIKQLIDRLDLSLQIIQEMDITYKGINKSFEDLTDTITGNKKFESRSFAGILTTNDPQILSIFLAAKKLNEELELTFINTQIKKRCSWYD